MKKVLFFINSLGEGGAERVLTILASALADRGFEVHIKALFGGVNSGNLSQKVKYTPLIKTKNNILIKLITKCYRTMNVEKFYNKYIKGDYDFEIAFLEGFPAKVISVSNNPNKYAWVHTDLFNNYAGHEKNFSSVEEHAECYKKFKRVFCVSGSAREGFKKRFGFDENVLVLYNPIDEKTVKEKAAEELTEIKKPSVPLVISVGRLVEQKGYERLLRVYKRLFDEGFEFELWILGEGEKRKTLENYIKENNLSARVKLLGFQKNPYKFMNVADLFVCSSIAEGFSSVVAEALICGKPVLSTDCSGADELLAGSEFGIITENSEEGLYLGMKKLLSDDELLSHYRDKAALRGKSFSLKERIDEIEKAL